MQSRYSRYKYSPNVCSKRHFSLIEWIYKKTDFNECALSIMKVYFIIEHERLMKEGNLLEIFFAGKDTDERVMSRIAVLY